MASPRLRAVNLEDSLLVGKPHAGSADQTLVKDHYVVLPTEQVRPYEDNPRHTANDRYDDIKAGFRTGGIDSVVLTVTQRPHQRFYICTFGGGTRLKAIKELLAETSDADRYGQIKCIVQPYRGEQALLAGHIAENTQRGEMAFWDLASAFQALRQKLEEDKRGKVSDRELEQRAQEAGLTISRARLNVYTFATAKLGQLACRSRLTFQAAAAVQPKWNLLERLAGLAAAEDQGAGERLAEAFRHALFQFDTEFERSPTREGFPVAMLLHGLDTAAAEALRLAPADLLHALDLAKSSTSTSMSWTQIQSALRNRAPAPIKRPEVPQDGLRERPAITTQELPRRDGGSNEFAAPVPPPARAGSGMRSSAPPHNLRGAALEAARTIASELEFIALVRPMDHFFGYWVEPLEVTDPRHQSAQWWPLLAMLSGQFHPDVLARIPPDSQWVRAMSSGARLAAAMPHPAMAWCNVLAGDAPYGRSMYEQTPAQLRPRRHLALVELVQTAMALVSHDPEAFESIAFHLGGAAVRKEAIRREQP